MAFHSLGGWKRSLFDDMAVHGVEGARFYTRLKDCDRPWPTGIHAGIEFVMPRCDEGPADPPVGDNLPLSVLT
jgi:malonate-semialdehyde dehydrogenase (acetylating)/methylmalonate-semialdehyde dehydrogenase